MTSLSQTIVNKLQILPRQKQQQFLDGQLSDLLVRNTENQLSNEEVEKLDRLHLSL